MRPIGQHIAASYKDGKLTLIRANPNGLDAAVTLSSEDMETLLDYWRSVRPAPTVEDLQAILDAGDEDSLRERFDLMHKSAEH